MHGVWKEKVVIIPIFHLTFTMTKKRDHQEATEDDEAVAVPETDEVLAERCAEYVELNRQIKELGARITLLRKNQKGLEKNLLAIMQTIKLEEIVVDGVKISRIKKLQIVEEWKNCANINSYIT